MARMSKAELAELQNPDNWEDEGEIRPPVKSPRAIVSVAFSREDFETVVKQAREQGMKTSEFIRHAAMERAVPPKQRAIISVSGGVKTNHTAIAAPQPKIEIVTPPVLAST